MKFSMKLNPISIALGCANFVRKTINEQSSKAKQDEMLAKQDEMLAKLDALAEGQSEIIGRLKIILNEVQWSQLVTQIASAVDYINLNYDKLRSFSAARPQEAAQWAENVLTPDGGIQGALYTINAVMMGKSMLTQPLMKVFAEKITDNQTSQSSYWEASSYFMSMLILQTKGYAVLANAYCQKNDVADASPCLEPYQHRFNDQTEYNKRYIDPLNQWYASPVWGAYYDLAKEDAHYVDTNPNLAPSGQVVTGLQLYPKGNRMGLKILAAPLNAYGTVVESACHWQDSPGWGGNYFDLNAKDNGYVDTDQTMIPDGYVVTGAQLYQKGNRLAIRLQATSFNPDTLQLETDKTQWTDSPGWDGNYYKIGDDHYVNTSVCQPQPASTIVGAALFKFGNRIAVQVNTVFYKI